MSLKRKCHILTFNSHPHPKKKTSQYFWQQKLEVLRQNNAASYGTRRHVVVLADTHHCSAQVHGNIL
jgi:hypothetical protein